MRSLTVAYVEAVASLHRQTRLAQADRDVAWDMVASLRADVAEQKREVAAWRRRAEALYDAAPVDLRDGVLGVIDTIERLAEVER